MEGVIEVQRRAHEDIDRLETAIALELLDPSLNQKSRLMQELTAAALLDQIGQTAAMCRDLYLNEDINSDRSKELYNLTVPPGEFGGFYTRLKELKDYHRRFPTGRPVDNSEFEALLTSCRPSEEAFDTMFSGEEMHGRYLDLLLPYERYVNLKNVRKLDYLQFIEEFDNFEAIPYGTKLSHAYSRYLEELDAYFVRYFRLAKPLFDLESVRKVEIDRFEELWWQAKIPGWEEVSKKQLALKSESAIIIRCAPCQKNFNNNSVFQAHLGGKRHLKALASYSGNNDMIPTLPSCNDSSSSSSTSKVDPPSNTLPSPFSKSNCKTVALKEFLVTRYAEILGQVRGETRINVERKQSRTLEERAEDVAVEETAVPLLLLEEEGEEVDDDRIYNPLNIPLDWDGKPIPYWLWKLHGLGVRFPCEICGNHVYMGRKAFDQHFFEWRHSNGMKALGIPNTKHFFQITRMAEAQTLWDKLKQASRTETFRPEAMEEFEDHLGNVYNRKTYEDLRRQGLI